MVKGLLIALLFCFLGEIVNEATLEVLLYPYTFIVQLFYPIKLVFQEGIGYVATDGSFVINRGCLGHTFMTMVFIVSYFSYIPREKQLGWLIKCGGLAIGIGYIVNSIRILASIPYIKYRYFGIIHGGIGVTLYIVALTTIYLFLKYKRIEGEG